MKQLLTILLLFPLFIACSSDDDNNHGDTLEEQIVGTWVITDPGSPGWTIIKTLVFSKDKNVVGYDENNELIIATTKYTVFADAVKFEQFTATIENNILTLNMLDRAYKYKRK